MPCEPGDEGYPYCSCPPPGGGGLFVQQYGYVPFPENAAGAAIFIPWRSPGYHTASLLAIHDGKADARTHYITGDGEGTERGLRIAHSAQSVADYIGRAEQFQTILHGHLHAAHVAFQQQTGQPWVTPAGFGVLDGHGLLKQGSRVAFYPADYKGSVIADVLTDAQDGPPRIRLTYCGLNEGWRRIESPVVKRGDDLQEWLRLREIWLPLFTQANLDADQEAHELHLYP